MCPLHGFCVENVNIFGETFGLKNRKHSVKTKYFKMKNILSMRRAWFQILCGGFIFLSPVYQPVYTVMSMMVISYFLSDDGKPRNMVLFVEKRDSWAAGQRINGHKSPYLTLTFSPWKIKPREIRIGEAAEVISLSVPGMQERVDTAFIHR